MTDMWTPPPPRSSYPQAEDKPKGRRRGLLVGAGLVGAGLVAGAVFGTTALSSAASSPSSAPSSSSSSSTSGSSSSSSSSTDTESGEHHGGGLDLSGTVTAVGSSSVTIKTSAGTVEYKVDANSDIDKNGEASLSSLAVGDAVTFSVDSTATTTIDKLHAGNEALNKPSAPAGSTTG